MALRFVRWIVISGAVLFVLATPGTIYTCGPWFESAVFTPGNGPFISQPDFAAGKVGIVLPTFRRAYLIVAYRYWSGLKFDEEQKNDTVDVFNRNVGPDAENEDDQIGTWRLARAEVMGVPPEPKPDAYAPLPGDNPYEMFLNCPNNAFKNAALTLRDRLKRYGKDSNVMRDWVLAQDQVFSNCSSSVHVIPAVLDSKDSLLRADREYQIAAADFYARDFDHGAAAFDAIAKDSTSPWAAISPYLAARAFIRKANFSSDSKFDSEDMKEAQRRLEKIVNDPKFGPMHDTAQRLLAYVRFRTEPEKRLAELEELMGRPDPGPDFRQHLWDYVLLVSEGKQAGDLSEWLRTFYADGLGYSQTPTRSNLQEEQKHAMDKWHSGHSLPWLIAALDFADANTPQANELLKAAEQVPRTSPAYLTVRYEAVRLLLRQKQEAPARRELDTLLRLPPDALAPADRNLLNDERQRLATSLSDFLEHTAEIPAYVGVEEDIGRGDEDDSNRSNSANDKAYFNGYVAQVLNGLPLNLQLESVQSAALPSHLRREIARSGWVRATLIGDQPIADKFEGLLQQLDNPLWKSMKPVRTAANDSERRFAEVFITLQNPGLQPAVREGLLRKATLGEIDSYRDNWWCGKREEIAEDHSGIPHPDISVPRFITEADKARAEQERKKLTSTGFAPNYLASEVIAYAKQHSDDPRLPQALHLAVRATRFGCTNPETTHLSKAAFDLLHNRYSNSEWAAKTKYYY